MNKDKHGELRNFFACDVHGEIQLGHELMLTVLVGNEIYCVLCIEDLLRDHNLKPLERLVESCLKNE